MDAFEAVDDEIERQDVIIKAAEKWSPQYQKHRDTFKRLLKLEARFEHDLRRYLRDYARRSSAYFNWYEYERLRYRIHAAGEFEINVLIEDGPINNEEGFLIQVLYTPIEEGVTLGGMAGEYITKREIGVSQTSEYVQDTAKRLVAQLVGKRVDENGILVDNPKAKYRITESIRKDIRQSIATSLNLGESQTDAKARVERVIRNPKRAEIIARTETVNAYQEGLLTMGRQSGAVGKQWQTVNYTDVCGENASQGIIRINDRFVSGHTAPAAHPNCRCALVLIYPEDPRSKVLL